MNEESVATTETSNRPRLSQIVAVVKDIKARSQSVLDRAYHTLQRAETRENSPLLGVSRKFDALNDDEAEKRPDESTIVQLKVEEIIQEVSASLVEMYDAVATQEWGDSHAKADLVIDGQTLLSDCPITYFIFLEKRLIDLHTFFSKLPIVSSSEKWELDPDAEYQMMTDPVKTRVTKKVPRNHEKAPATDKHPAQVEMFFEDTAVGYWTTRKFSGATTSRRKAELLRRVDVLRDAVKSAREEANSTRIDQIKVGKGIFDYLLNSSSE